MASIKLETDLTEQELIELARKAKPVPVSIHSKTIFRESAYHPLNDFISKLGIQPGKYKIRTKDLYVAFCKLNTEIPSKRKFAIELSKIFKKSSVHYYLINVDLETLNRLVERLASNEQAQSTEVSSTKA